jgi:FKBP-type peptidyl-prolyl cis-trans isomerase SlyD
MEITQNKVVILSYELSTYEEDGEKTLIEKTDAANPFVFLFGHSDLPEKFEENMKGKKEGDSFNFTISSDESGYGEYNEEAVVDFPINVFLEGGMTKEELDEGQPIVMKDEQGQRHQGTVMEVEGETVTVDFNHPLAGLDLEFSIKVINVRDATPEEIEHGHVHGPGGHNHH